MNDLLTPDVLFTLRVLGIAFAAAWGFRAFRGAKINLRVPKVDAIPVMIVAGFLAIVAITYFTLASMKTP